MAGGHGRSRDARARTEANWRDAAEKHQTFAFSETPRYVGRAVAALAADPKVARKAGLAVFVGDLADEYGFTDVDGSRPHFSRNAEAWVDREIAAGGELGPTARRMAISRYMHTHLTPSRAEKARAYAETLGFKGLGGGLRPVD